MSRFGWSVMVLGVVAAASAKLASADPSDRRFYVAPMGSFVLGDRERGSKFGFGGELALGKRVTTGLELELIGTYTNYRIKQSDFPDSAGSQPGSSNLYGGGGGFNVYLSPSSDGWLGGLYLHADAQRGEGRQTAGPKRSYGTTLFNAGLGYNYEFGGSLFGLMPAGTSLRAEALYRHDAHGEGELGTAYGNEHKYFQEAVFNIGLRIPFGGEAKPEASAPEETAEVVPAQEPAPETPAAPPPCELAADGQPLKLDGCKTGDTLVLRGVNFDFNQATLEANAKTILDGVATALQTRPDIKVEVDGHTDGKGSAPYNQKLSERRAAAVRVYLLSRGIDGERMTTRGFGKSKPIADNDTDDGREMNRRVELNITAASEPAAASESVPTSGAVEPEVTPSNTPSAADTTTPPTEPGSGDSSGSADAPAAGSDSATPPADNAAPQ